MNKDLIETPRFNFFIGDEVLLKGKIVGFDVDENKCVENVVRLEYGQTLNVPNSTIHITDDIIDKFKIKVTIPQFVADWIEYCKRHNFTLFGCLDPVDGFERLVDENFEGDARKCIRWCRSASDKLARAWLDGYEVGVEEEKKYKIKLLNRNDGDLYLVN